MSKKMTSEEFSKKHEILIGLYDKGLSQVQIANKLGKSRAAIIKTIKKGIALGVLNVRDETFVTKSDKSPKELLKEQDERRLVQQQVREQSRTELIIEIGRAHV